MQTRKLKTLLPIYLTLFYFFCLCDTTPLAAQKIEKIRGNNYEYQGTTYPYSEMDAVFDQNIAANTYYELSKKQINTSKTWGIVSLGSLAFGAGLVALSPDAKGFLTVSTGDAIGAIFIVLIFPISGITGIIIHSNAKKNQRRAIDLFNSDIGIIIPKSSGIEISLAGTSNGVGIRLSF